MDNRILFVYAIIAVVSLVALVLPVQADPSLSLADARVTEGTGPGTTAISFDLSTSAPQPSDCRFRAVLTHGDTDDTDFTSTAFFDVTGVFDTDDEILPRSFGITRDAVFEPDETMTLTVTGDGPNPCVIGDGVAVGTIVNDDLPQPPLSLADARVTEGTGPGTTAISFDLSTSAPQPTDCRFRAILTHGDTDDADFTSTAFFDVTGVFDTDDETLPRTFGITRDAVFEPDETMTLTVTGDGPNPCVIGDGVAVGTIVNDDLPQPPLSLADARVTEGTGPGTTAISFDLSTSAPQPTDCRFRAILTHGDTDDADFTSTAFFDVTGVFDTDDEILPRTFGITRDALFEPDETMTLTVTGDGPNPCVIADGVATGTIVNDDNPQPSLSLADARVTEGTGPGTTAISFDLSTSAPQPSDCRFRAVLTHGDTDDADFTSTAFFDVTGVFDTDDETLPRSFGITRDAVFESDETMTLTVTGDGPNPCVIADGVATGTIVNDDIEPPAVPEFPLTGFPVMMIILFLGVVLVILRIR